MPEAVRLVVWDLDETYWRGTVTEGGIKEYVQEHHDIVIELAQRGIMSSICSKNDRTKIEEILRNYKIFEYFIFPSISWEPKGIRLANLINTVQLRATNVLFVDDNPNNRAEAVTLVPDLQVEDEKFIGRMLSDPRFKGKDDSQLTRLKQYKLLEARKRDEQEATGDNEEFLRQCNIKVYIEYDIASHVDRVIELINRTNQLNYTKRRLPEDIVEARKILLAEVNAFNRQAGLIKVVDKYGDYGFVGFFEIENQRQHIVEGAALSTLRHYCFSCRTLGMYVEQWVYEYLRRPEINLVGEVLTNLTEPRIIDWIQIVEKPDEPATEQKLIAPVITLSGGCESNAVGVYLGSHTAEINVYGNYATNGLFVRINSAPLSLDICTRSIEEFANELEILGLPLQLSAFDIFGSCLPGSIYIFNFGMDALNSSIYIHKHYGWKILVEPRLIPGLNFVSTSEDELARRLNAHGPQISTLNEQTQHVLRVGRHIRQNYDLVRLTDAECVDATRRLIERVPTNCKLILALNHHEVRVNESKVYRIPSIASHANTLRELADEYSYVGVVSFSDVLTGHDELQVGGNHYSRPVYLRFSERLIEVSSSLSPRPQESDVDRCLGRRAGAGSDQARGLPPRRS